MSKPTHIYALTDPTGSSQRVYVGKTIDIRRRYRQHCNPRRRSWLHDRWLRKILLRGAKPELVILETVPAGGDWQEAERFWIASLRFMGLPMANLASGGQGPVGMAHSAATRKKMSVSQAGRSGPLTPEQIRQRIDELRPADGFIKKKSGRPPGSTMGVYATGCASRRRYAAHITLVGRLVYLGSYDALEAAQQARVLAAQCAWGSG